MTATTKHRLPAINPATMAAANEVLATFRDRGGIEYLRFELTAGRLYIASRHGRKGYVLRGSDMAWPAFQYGSLGMGGTEAQATAQLVRWVRGTTRRPMACWEYWCSDTVGLGTADTLQLLRERGYADPELTACVLCGSLDRPTDWWSLNGGVGPCCRFGVCRKRGDS